jgi:beta-glucosidase/6-phospho-beta-glucosidase/beta-galactosidase
MRFERHYNRSELESLFSDGFSLPPDFFFGVANSGFQVEGGFNGPGEPLNNWLELERSGKVEPSGDAIRFWTDYGTDIGLAAGIGLNAFRLGIEWARVQPATSPRGAPPPPFDAAAVEGYAKMIAAVMKEGMEPFVTLHHFTHPFWLGIDLWLEPGGIDHFIGYVGEFVETVNALLVEKHGARPVKYWITMNEPNALALGSYLVRYMPHHRWGVHTAGRAWSGMIEGHCRAYDSIHGIYEKNGWGEPRVTYNTAQMEVYEFDKVMTDMLTARRNGVARRDLADYLRDGREKWYREIARCPEVVPSRRLNRRLEEFVLNLAGRVFNLEDFSSGIDAVYESGRADKLDFLAVDFYDPFFRHMVRMPGRDDLREGRINLHYEHWEWVLNPRAMYHFLKGAYINGEDLPIVILENGMAYKVHDGKVAPRGDGATRDRFLQCFLFEAMRALKDGVPLKGYFYWTLVDNYEWGSYEPRFGLFTVDRAAGAVRSTVDAWGVNAGLAFSELISALMSGDRDRAVDAFWRGAYVS